MHDGLTATLSRYWRVVATGLSFLVFGVGGLLLGGLVFPALGVVVRKPETRVTAARTLIRWAFRFYVDLMRALGVLRYQIRGMEKLDRGGLLILANHPTLIDTVFLMAFVKNADCIVKGELWHNPFTRGALRAAGYISNQGGPELVDDCIASLRRGNNLIVFPEGTRTPGNGVISMKRGAANIAVRGARDMTPVLIRCEPATLGKGDKWWRVPSRRVLIRIDVQDDLAIAAFNEEAASNVMAARQLTEFLQNYFTGKCQSHA
ncbi:MULTISPECIES: 1-acyl-sn-glycerol-3-phosphate acyltransferase [unclassified Duganella]|uniref:lysophospholipid acyltransferase family protein n=1 Tax=unclassified Duganella TaxID=2636909 RepID=UPI000E355191|nr:MULTISPECIES: lysophospholipid acyltransferase family protein [unclassified Duganella]RFP14551.1 1-acyl-sn-glycerol-3-phosphate acyltransferase [Duganella sp. BJB475]RFP30899.1 1-acyl-sn-glycerol-3-phosphate acyltransferase [Duganella sp. BJB476]